MPKNIERANLPFDLPVLMAYLTPHMSKVDKFPRDHNIDSQVYGPRFKRQNFPLNPDVFISDNYRATPSQIASLAENDSPNNHDSRPILVAAPPVTHLTPQPARNVNSTTTVHKPLKHTNNSTVTSTTFSKNRQTGVTNDKHTIGTPSTTVTSVETGLGMPLANPTPKAIHHSQQQVSSTTLYSMIGGAILAVFVLGLCIWGYCSSKQKRDVGRRSLWRMATNDEDTLAFGAHLEKFNSSDAKILNTVRGNRLRGDSLSKRGQKIVHHSRTRESELWGSGEEIHDYPLIRSYSYGEKDRVKSPYEDLDFGPSVMSTFESAHPPILTIPPTAHHSKATYPEVNTGVNGLGLNGWERVNQALERQLSQKTVLAAAIQKQPGLSKSKTTYDQSRGLESQKNQLASSSSMNRMDELANRDIESQSEDLRRKKDTIVGLTDAYENGWDTVEPMPTDARALQSCSLNPAFSNLNDQSKSLPDGTGTQKLTIPPSALVATTTFRNVSPLTIGLPSIHLDSTTTRPLMSPSEASKELEHMLNSLEKDLSHHLSSAEQKNLDLQFLSGSSAANPSHLPSHNEAFSSAQLNSNQFSQDHLQPSETPKIIGDISPKFIDTSIRGVSGHSQSCDVANHAGMPLEQFSTYSELYPNVNESGSTEGCKPKSPRVPSFIPLTTPNLTPSFTGLDLTPTSLRFSNIDPNFFGRCPSIRFSKSR
ncbi:hypothetical protein CROQUDRAFT_92650 [Cronartium quercuum f. sp. fusiforme G11]|uniref:Uncharacterized protein n=1 Tax=Cronartium quercuum f. sp. fusiforme G11 TaxID=708437 RepID=A0A9P6NN43_9BASI|nr:hypothetical protein CROQUDRAFT_92650 [Cronartium quercuum f. sp. fusiforme G11]